MNIYFDIRNKRIYGQNRFCGPENSAMRHCVISCMVAKDYGILISFAAGTVNEYQGFYIHDLPQLRDRFSGGAWAFHPEILRIILEVINVHGKILICMVWKMSPQKLLVFDVVHLPKDEKFISNSSYYLGCVM